MNKGKAVWSLIVGLVLLTTQPVFAAPPEARSATGSGVLAEVRVGNTLVRIGVDEGRSLWGDTQLASSELSIGEAAGTTLAGGQRRLARRRDESGKTTVVSVVKSIAGVVELNVAGGSVGADLAPDHVTSASNLQLSSLGILGGIASLTATRTAASTVINAASSTSERTFTLGETRLLSLGDLLAKIGANPLALACAAVESAGSGLGVDTASACEQLASIQTAIEGATGALDAARATLAGTVSGLTLSQVQSDEAAVEALSCDALDLVCQATSLATLVQINTNGAYGVDLAALGFTEARDALLVRLQGLVQSFADLGILDGGIAGAAAGTCAAVTGALGDVSAGVPGLASTLDPLAWTVDSACDALVGTLDSLLDVPLLSVGAGTITVRAVATKGTPSAVATTTVGGLKVGNVEIGGASIDGAAISSAVSTLRNSLGSVLDALGIGLPTPEVDVMKATTNKGKNADGSWFANASVVGLHVRIPSVSLSLPATNPLGVLSGTGGLSARPASVARLSGGPAAPVTTPQVLLDAARFSAQSRFTPPGELSPRGATLPRTGERSPAGPILLGLLLVLAASRVRRILYLFD